MRTNQSFAIFVLTIVFSSNGFCHTEDFDSDREQPIQVITLGKKNATLRFLIQGGMHGNETTTPEFVEWVAKRFQEGRSSLNSLPSSIGIDFIPRVNPKGVQKKTRLNPNGVDLNRNFSILWGKTTSNPGPKAFSEKESQTIKKLFNERNYLASADVHGYVNWLVAPSPPSMIKDSNQAQKREWQLWMKALQTEIKKLPVPYELKTAGQLGDGGAFEDWAFWKKGTLAFCLELSSRNIPHLGKSRLSFETYENALKNLFLKAIQIKEANSKDLDLAASF